jgi:heme-degrading monooxygenase HmoA
MEMTIREDRDITTLINILTVEPENRQSLLALLKEGTESTISKMAGWISTSLLDGKDGRQVIIFSQWRSLEDIEAMRKHRAMAPYVQRLAALAKFEAIACDVSYIHHA